MITPFPFVYTLFFLCFIFICFKHYSQIISHYIYILNYFLARHRGGGIVILILGLAVEHSGGPGTVQALDEDPVEV